MKTLLKIVLLAGILISISKNANAQKPITWQRTYGDGNIDYGYSIVQTPDEGYIAVGRKRINTSNFIYAMRINKFGDTIWTKTYNGAVAYDIQMLDYNNYVICGSSFIKIDINGNLIWNHSLNWPYPKKFLISKENGFYLITSIDSIISAYPLIQKMDSKGNLLWSRIYKEGIADGWFTDIKQDAKKNLLLTGIYSDTVPLSYSLFVMKTDLNGNIIFFRKYDSLQTSNLICEKNNEFMLCGNSSNDITYQARCSEIGNIIWKKNYDNGYPEYGYSHDFIKTIDNGYASLGTYHNGNFSYFFRLIKTDSVGNEQWRKLYGFNDHDEGFSLNQTIDSGFILIGIRDNFNLGDIFIVKTDKTGFASPPVKIINNPYQNILSGNFNIYPNPFNSFAKIEFDIPKKSFVDINLYDLKGSLVKHVIDKLFQAGSYSINLKMSNIPSGIYFCKIQIYNEFKIFKLIVLK